jgi:O-antigen ligase
MKREDTGLFCLLAAVFFSIVAGGHVQIDAKPDTRAALGLFLTFLACLGSVSSVFVLSRNRKSGLASAAFAITIGFLLFDVLEGGAMFATMRVFVALLVFGGLAFAVGTSRIVQMPSVVYAGFLALLVAALGTSILVSEFRSVSASVWLNWVTYAAGLYLAVAVLGRKTGPRLLIEVFVLATGTVAAKGVLEYLLVRATEPTHRIFADWNNPNALAGLMLTALPLALALACAGDKTKRIAAGACAALMVTAIALTQSLGGMLVAPIGVGALLVAALAWKQGRSVLPAFAPLAAGVAIVFLVQLTTPRQIAAGPVQATVATTEQSSSAEYRKLLWRGAVQLIESQPVGIGVGAYRFHSARSGLNEQTHLTHQTYLQIALEGGPIALIGILGLGVAWLVRMFIGARSLDRERNVLRAGVLGAVVACGANGLLESNLYYFGAGFLLFVLLGAGLQLAADGTSPESLPSGLRGLIVVTCCVAPFAVLLWIMYVENAKSALLESLGQSDRSVVLAARDSLAAIAGPDSESWYLLAWIYPPSPDERVALYKRAVRLGPSTRHLRGLAQAQADTGETDEALKTIDRALKYDPNNLRTLAMKMGIEEGAGATIAAIETANRIIAVEETPYMQTRALAELVPTEPFEARLFIAKGTKDENEKARLMREAVDGYVRYRHVTVPKVLQFDSEGLDFLGETRAEAEQKLAIAKDAAEQLERLYESMREPEMAKEARAAMEQLTLNP